MILHCQSPQLLADGRSDYFVYEGLAEITMASLSRAKAKDPDQGYARDIIETIGRKLGPEREKGMKVVTNAGGVNPGGGEAGSVGGSIREGGGVLGDDLTGNEDVLARVELSGDLLSANVYLGARPIAAALDSGAGVVVTGQMVDSALVLGPLIHEFGWGRTSSICCRQARWPGISSNVVRSRREASSPTGRTPGPGPIQASSSPKSRPTASLDASSSCQYARRRLLARVMDCGRRGRPGLYRAKTTLAAGSPRQALHRRTLARPNSATKAGGHLALSSELPAGRCEGSRLSGTDEGLRMDPGKPTKGVRLWAPMENVAL